MGVPSIFLALRAWPISPDLLCWWALEVCVYVGVPSAAHLRQTRKAVNFGVLTRQGGL
jgi:hypothetical protein